METLTISQVSSVFSSGSPYFFQLNGGKLRHVEGKTQFFAAVFFLATFLDIKISSMKKLLQNFSLLLFVFTGAAGFSQSTWNPEICLVTVDSSTASYINVIWNKPSVTDIDSFYIYRADSNQTSFQKIAAIAFEDSSVYDDIAVNVNTTWYSYMISALDTNGVEGLQSSPANSCLLDVVPDLSNGYYTCKWNLYQNSSNFPTLSRCLWDSLGNANSMQQVGNNFPASWTSWNHTGYSQAANSIYRLEVEVGSACSPERAIINSSRSNLKGVANPTLLIKTPEEASSLVRVFPNPSNGIFMLEWNAAMNVMQIEIVDVTGRVIRSFSAGENQLKKSIQLNEANGIYFVNFLSAKGVVSKKIVLN